MRKIALASMGLIVLAGLTGCNKVTEFRLDMEAQSFRQECFANNTYDCVNRRVDYNEKLLSLGKKQVIDAHDLMVAKIGEQRYQIVLQTFDAWTEHQEKDRPNIFMRWFFGSHQILDEMTGQYLFTDQDIDRLIADAVDSINATPGVGPLPKPGSTNAPANAPSVAEKAQSPEGVISKALEGPVNVGPATPAPSANQAAQVPAAPNVAVSPTLAKLFVPDAIQGNVAWFETMTGPARQVQNNGNGTQSRIYQVDGCKVTARATNQTINEISLDLAPNCNVPLKSMVANSPDMSVSGLTFADLFKNGAGEVELECAGYNECGNASDPFMHATLGGSHADNFMKVVFSGVIAGDQDVAALQDLLKTESAHTGKTDMDLDAKVYNNDPQFPGLVQQKMGGVKVTSITFKSSM